MLLKLFLVFIQIGLLSFGGGLASLPIIQYLVINQQHWIDILLF
ncbi:MAG: chromate transporter, partial [Bacilli bacterium]